MTIALNRRAPRERGLGAFWSHSQDLNPTSHLYSFVGFLLSSMNANKKNKSRINLFSGKAKNLYIICENNYSFFNSSLLNKLRFLYIVSYNRIVLYSVSFEYLKRGFKEYLQNTILNGYSKRA